MGCGWLGLPLAQALISQGFTVKGSTTTQEKVPELESKGIQPYLIPKGAVHITPSDFFESDILIINVPPRNSADDPNFHQKNMEAVSHLIPKDTHVIFISSSAVYPNTNLEVSEEDASHDCVSRGGVSLLTIEDLFASDSSTIIRFGGLYGPNRHPGRFLSGKTIGGRNNAVNMIHLEDCIAVISEVIKQKIWGYRLNASSPIRPSKEQFYMDATDDLGVAPPIFTDEEIPFKIVNSERLIELIGYRFKH